MTGVGGAYIGELAGAHDVRINMPINAVKNIFLIRFIYNSVKFVYSGLSLVVLNRTTLAPHASAGENL